MPCEQRAHFPDAVAHRRELREPCLRQLRIRENAGGDSRAVIGRHRINTAGDLQDVALHGVGARFALTHGDDRADPLAVQAEVLGVRHGDHGLRKRLDHQPQARGVLLEVRTESLISQVDERQEALARKQLRERAPLPSDRSAPQGCGRSVHQHHIARARALQPLEHGFEQQPVSGGVVVGVALELAGRSRRGAARGCPRSDRSDAPQPSGATARMSSAPTRSAPQPPGRLRGPCAARRMRRMRGAQHQGLDGGVVFLAPRSRHVGFGRLPCKHQLLGAAHAVEHRRVAAGIPVDADAQVDFLWEGIGAKLRHEPQDLIWLQPVDGLKQRRPLFLAAHYSPGAAPPPAALGGRKGGPQIVRHVSNPRHLFR